MEFKMQSEVLLALQGREWYTVGQVANRIGAKPTSTIRCILETFCFLDFVDRQVGYSENNRLSWQYRLK